MDAWNTFFPFGFQGRTVSFRGCKYTNLGGGFKYFLFSPLLGEDFQFDEDFSDGLKPPTSNVYQLQSDD